MGSPSLYSARKTTLALAVALSFAWQAPVFAHGGEAHMVPMDKTLKEFGADVQWDDYAQLFTLIKDGAYVKVKPGAQTAIVNGQPLALQVPVVMKDNKAWVSDTFINDVFQSGLDQTFQVEKRLHPLNALTADEIKQAVEIVKASADFKPNTRFTEISLLPPDKEAVWAFALENKPVDQPRKADVIMLDGKHIIEAVVDLQNNKLLSWQPIKDAHGMVLLDDLEQKKIVKIEEGPVVPVPMTARPFDGRDRVAPAVKPMQIIEPEGKNYTITGDMIHWRNWDFHLSMNSRVGPMISTVTYNDNGTKRKVMYEGSLGGMIVPYGDPDIGWYFKAYLDSGDYGMGTLTSPIARGKDAPSNAVLLNETIADYTGVPMEIPRAIAVFERYAGPEYKHQEMGQPNVSTERRELVVRWISTVGNYDYIFDWIFHENGTIGIDAGATGIEAVKGVKAKTMHDETAKDDTRYGTLIDHNIVGTTHQHIYNFRLDLDVDGENNSLVAMDPVVKPNTAGGPRTSTMQVNQYNIGNEQDAAQKFDPGTIRLLSNPNKENRMGNPVSYQIIPYAGGTHPVAKGAQFAPDEWIYHRLSFMDKQLWVTRYHPGERFPEGKYPNRSTHDTGLGQYSKDNESLDNTDAVIWMTTGTTHVARAEEWPIMPTEWVHTLLKPWNFFDETPTLGALKKDK